MVPILDNKINYYRERPIHVHLHLAKRIYGATHKSYLLASHLDHLNFDAFFASRRRRGPFAFQIVSLMQCVDKMHRRSFTCMQHAACSMHDAWEWEWDVARVVDKYNIVSSNASGEAPLSLTIKYKI